MSSLRPMQEAEKDENGNRIITVKFIKNLCEQQELFDTPNLNKRLYLHYQGFIDIRNLDEYTNLRALWLENNLISRISGLNNLSKLRCLYLQHNGIEKIDNLNSLTELVTLNLSYNKISKIENLQNLVSLEDFDISHNRIVDSFNLIGLENLECLQTLDLSYNELQDNDHVISVLEKIQGLACLYLKGVDKIREIENYRKIMIAKLMYLKYLDERPVKERERELVDDWIHNECDGKIPIKLAPKDPILPIIKPKIVEEQKFEEQIASKLLISNLASERLEELLVENFFSFEKVHKILAPDYKCSPESLRLKWCQHEISLRGV